MILSPLTLNPVPPSEIVESLQRVDPDLGLRFVSFPVSDGPNVNGPQWWAITLKWQSNDRRRRMIDLGHMAQESDFDVLVYLPLDCSVRDAESYLLNHVRRTADKETASKRLLDNIHKYNQQVRKNVLAPTMELAEELIETNAKTMFREEGKEIPTVLQAGFDPKKK